MADTKKIITTRDLKTFIEAVEFAADQPEWVPSPRQWLKIRSMINDLEEAPAPQPVRAAPPPPSPPQWTPPSPPQYQLAPGGLGGAMDPRGAPPALGGFEMGQQGALKTPSIDTSSGDYQSGFV